MFLSFLAPDILRWKAQNHDFSQEILLTDGKKETCKWYDISEFKQGPLIFITNTTFLPGKQLTVYVLGKNLQCVDSRDSCDQRGKPMTVVVNNRSSEYGAYGQGRCPLFCGEMIRCDMKVHTSSSYTEVCEFDCDCPPEGCGNTLGIIMDVPAFINRDIPMEICEIEIIAKR